MNLLKNLLKKIDVNIIDTNDTETVRNDGDIIYTDISMFDDILNTGGLGVGESYMKGKWICHNNKLDVLIYKILKNDLPNKIKIKSWSLWLWQICTNIFNYQTKKKSYDVEHIHYNIDNKIYEYMLGSSMSYTCAYFKDENNNLDKAQYDKFQLICDKIHLSEDDDVLDIGCGFGILDKYMVEKVNCTVTAVNISKEQLKYANHIRNGLETDVKERLLYIEADYRDIKGMYNKIISIGLCEHVGYRNYRTFFKKVYDCLEDGGIFLMHTIGSNISVTCTDPWIDKYIFPGGMPPSIKQIGEAMEGLFILEDVHNFGPDYYKTLLAWHKNYSNALKDKLIEKSEEFNRMWDYYLLSCAGNFKARKLQLWQFVLTKNNENKYTGCR